MSRDVTALQQDGLKAIFDEKKVVDRLEMGQLAGEVGFTGAGDLSSAFLNQATSDLQTALANGDVVAAEKSRSQVEAWADGGTYRAIVHAAAGAVTAALGGSDALKGAIGAGSVEAVRDSLARYLIDSGVTYGSTAFDTLMEAASLAVGAAISGQNGAATALAGDKFNRQLHPDETNWLIANAGEFAKQLFGCATQCTAEQLREAQSRLIIEASASLDAKLAAKAGGVDLEAQRFINANPVTFGWGQAFTATEDQYYDFKYFADLMSKDKQAFTDLTNALSDAGWTKRDMQDAYYDQLLALASAQRGADGKAIIETFTGDVGMALGIVRKLMEGDTEGASFDAVLAALPFGIAKTLGAVRPLAKAGENTVWLNGYVIDAGWVNAKGQLTWRHPLTNVIEALPDSARVHVDRILPQKALHSIDGFDELPSFLQKKLLEDPRNLQPMIASANCSKGCRVESGPDGWMTWNGQPVSPEYKMQIERLQRSFREQVLRAVKEYRKSNT
ncbi:hypothetical protein ICJ04_00740 [Stenotrophomonas sp. 169]|uniref:hypothetical protein n=1 Tax=Stenotrophomonas sp. 169 TaxID=2770322 RepID=UPI00166233E5|nr:hypothetical protein [Stenotrophomonas sp. 169]QNR97487.1 hypothetical protein ICJ04_00740 [Stenotrophomonas sp. 169]